MALFDLADPTLALPSQMVLDSLPQDALILAEAERLGVTAVATLDRDWQRLTEFDVHTVLD